MDFQKGFKILAVTMWISSTVYFCYTSTTIRKQYFREEIKMLVYKHALKEHDISEVEKSQHFLEEYKYYDKPMRVLLFMSCVWGILVGTGTYAAAWMIYFILKWLIFGFSDNQKKALL